MDYFQAFWLALIQGVTEFLPISSSGHLALVPSVLGWSDQGLAFDVAVHVGTLVAVLIYFRTEVGLLIGDWLQSIINGRSTTYSKLAWSIAFASLLIGVAGYFLEEIVSTVLRNPVSIALTTIVFGVLLWIADARGARDRGLEMLSWKDVLVISIAQIFALIPGTSRSGVTITAGLLMGLTRQASAKLSFLMAIPVILMAGVWQARGLVNQPADIDWGILIFGALISAIVAFICINFFLRYLQRFSLVPFAIYRLILGVILLATFL